MKLHFNLPGICDHPYQSFLPGLDKLQYVTYIMAIMQSTDFVVKCKI